MSKPPKNVDQTQGKRRVRTERAISDGAWHSRPLWRVVRPDHEYGPKLTAAARRLMAQEQDHAADQY